MFLAISLLLFLISSLEASEVLLPFSVFITRDKIEFKENYGTFKVKRKTKEVCYPQKYNPRQNRVIVDFPTCDIKVAFEKQGDSWKFSSEKNQKEGIFIHFHLSRDEKEKFFGLGTQFTHFLLNGHKFPILSQEQGNGRGQQPLTFWQRMVAQGIQGHQYTTYHAQTFFLSSQGRIFYLESPSYMEADFTFQSVVRISHLGLEGRVYYINTNQPKDALLYSRKWLGKQERLPDWIHKGAILGLMGGTEKVQERVLNLYDSGASLSGVWLQDWVGTRKTILGPRLQWNWRLSQETYPDWDQLLQFFKERDLKVLGYFNPYLSDYKQTNGLLKEAKRRHLLVEENGKLLEIEMGGFKANLVNLFKPEAFNWLKNIMIKEALKNGLHGWMADFGEAYPVSPGNSGQHHLYIQRWQQLNKEVRQELNKGREYPTVSFHRSGSIKSLQRVGLFWLGDQTPTYDEFDGLKSTVRGLLSSGLNGVAYNHSDIGGYFAIKIPLILSVKRSKALLKRWMEVNAFTMVFRTHLGLKPKLLYQIDQDEEIKGEFSKWSRVFSKLFNYRKKLIEEYESKALPPVRPLFLEFPNESETYHIQDQFMFGPQYLVAPIYKDFEVKKKLYLPKGQWKHLWDDREIHSSGEWVEWEVFENTSPVFIKS